jgi:aspartate/methionine/tyrosine aminotransferase
LPKALAPPPRYPDTEAALRAAGGAADRYQLLAAGRILRQQRLEELEKAIAGCR